MILNMAGLSGSFEGHNTAHGTVIPTQSSQTITLTGINFTVKYLVIFQARQRNNYGTPRNTISLYMNDDEGETSLILTGTNGTSVLTGSTVSQDIENGTLTYTGAFSTGGYENVLHYWFAFD